VGAPTIPNIEAEAEELDTKITLVETRATRRTPGGAAVGGRVRAARGLSGGSSGSVPTSVVPLLGLILNTLYTRVDINYKIISPVRSSLVYYILIYIKLKCRLGSAYYLYFRDLK
jgi:hypothetical protein